MRLMLHTLKKDLRRLWPVILAVLALLAAQTNMDRWRYDWVASPIEGWLNLLLPLAWGCLAALAVLEEPLVGDRNFWTTRPHRWSSLLGAKLAFAVLTIHLPALVCGAWVMAMHGFSPAAFAGQLLGRQVLLFGAVTLPAAALATLVRNFAHFMVTVFAVAALLAILNSGFGGTPAFYREAADVRHGAVRIALAAAAIAVIGIQYARRREWTARAAALGGAVVAVLLSTTIPVQAEYSTRANAAPEIALRDATYPHPITPTQMQHNVMLPVSVRNARGELYRVPFVDVEITAADGTVLRSVRPMQNRPFDQIALLAYPPVQQNGPMEWLTLRFSGPSWEHVKKGPVRIRGDAGFEFYRLGTPVALSTSGESDVAGAGHCSVRTVPGRYGEELLKVLCESPDEIPPTSVTLHNDALQRSWYNRLNSSRTDAPGPHETWLSPINRAQAFFGLADLGPADRALPFFVPRATALESKVLIAPEVGTGRALAHFEWRDVSLSGR